ncbi:MAG: hypothetical protein IKU62_00465 [Ruminiclostridium sp.]|nr:hypothetical protein [Ruminiclostridium sp.]
MNRRFLACFCGAALVLSLLFAGVVWVVDPWYHFHGPAVGLPLTLRDGRYQNEGIAEHLEYDTLLLGTSVTANMHTEDLDRLTGGEAQKLIVLGGYFSEFYGPLDRALESHAVKEVYWGVDSNCLRRLDAENTWVEPTYLFDQNPFNDVTYLLNKEMFFWDLTEVLERAWEGNHRDEATGGYTWGEDQVWSKETAISVYRTMEEPVWTEVSDDAFLAAAEENLENILRRVDENPEVTFTFYLAPYSILFWHMTTESGELEATLTMHQRVLESLTSRSNTRVFYFMDNTRRITDLSQYCDYVHYSPAVCEELLEEMVLGEPLDSQEIDQRLDAFRTFLQQYDYDAILSQ